MPQTTNSESDLNRTLLLVAGGLVLVIVVLILVIRGGNGDDFDKGLVPAVTPTERPPSPTVSATAGPTGTPPGTETPEPPQGPETLDTFAIHRSTYYSSRIITVTSIELLSDETMRVNLFFKNNGDDDQRRDPAREGSIYIIDENGQRLEPMGASSGWYFPDTEPMTVHSGERAEGWILFPMLQGSATTFYLQIENYKRIEGVRLVHLAPSAEPGVYDVARTESAIYSNLDAVLNLDSVEILDDGTMRLNISIVNEDGRDRTFDSSLEARVRDENGRVYQPVLGVGSRFDRAPRLHHLEKADGWLLFPELSSGARSFEFEYPEFNVISGVTLP